VAIWVGLFIHRCSGDGSRISNRDGVGIGLVSPRRARSAGVSSQRGRGNDFTGSESKGTARRRRLPAKRWRTYGQRVCRRERAAPGRCGGPGTGAAGGPEATLTATSGQEALTAFGFAAQDATACSDQEA